MNLQKTPSTNNAGEKPLRLLRPSIVVLCGPAACGKSTFAARHFRPTQIISSDWARACICDDERDQRYNAQAFALVHFLVEQRLMVNRLCVVDSTALTTQARRKLVELAKKHHVPTTLLLFDVPLETCIQRDEKRERSVGRAIVERHYQAFKLAQEAIPQEGFDQIVEIRDDDLEMIHIEVLFRPIAPQPEASGPSTAKGRTPSGERLRSEQGHPPVKREQPARAVRPVASPTIAKKPSVPPPPAATPSPAPPSAPQPVPPDTSSSGEKSS